MNRLAVLIIFYCNLGLTVRTKVWKSSVFTDLGQLTGQLVCQGDWLWHVFFGFVGGVTEHHTLVAGTDSVDICVGHFVFFCF